MTAPSDRSRLVRAGLLTGVSDAIFSSVLNVFFYHSTVARLWQGVASVLLGKSALDGGTPMVLVGLLMHFGVAFGWSTVFLLLLSRRGWIQRVLASPFGTIKVAAVYGPCIWMFMSLVLIPVMLQRAPTITIRWWVQFFGHIPFVALPIVASIGAGTKRSE